MLKMSMFMGNLLQKLFKKDIRILLVWILLIYSSTLLFRIYMKIGKVQQSKQGADLVVVLGGCQPARVLRLAMPCFSSLFTDSQPHRL